MTVAESEVPTTTAADHATAPQTTLRNLETDLLPDLDFGTNGRDYGLPTTRTPLAQRVAEVNKELWLVLSMLILAVALNYLVTAHRVVLGFYVLPTIFSAYVYGRRHATLTAAASFLTVVLLAHFNGGLLAGPTPAAGGLAGRWFDLLTWGGILMVTAHTMGTLHERHRLRVAELQETYRGLLMILRQFISKDKYTENHSYRVSFYAANIATRMGLTSALVEDIRAASMLHDIGKLDISRQLLHKASAFTVDEQASMQQHVPKGGTMLDPLGGPLKRILPMILAHHEKFDGSGEQKLRGNRIPLGARVITVADVYDALTSDRPYRKAMSTYDASEIIVKGAGKEFDPAVVRAFVEAQKRGGMEVPEIYL